MKLSPRPLPAAAALLAGAGLALVAAPPSYAVGGVTVSISATTLVIGDAVGADNQISVSADAAKVYVRDLVVAPTPSSGCVTEAFPSGTVSCPRPGLTALSVGLGNGNDGFSVVGLALPATIDGGPGNDGIQSGPGSDAVFGGTGTDTVGYASAVTGVVVTLGTATGNGAPGENDALNADIENAQGSDHDDHLIGTSGVNGLDGRGGNDLLDGGLGDDDLQGNAGIDTVTFASRTQPVTAYLGAGVGMGGGQPGESDNISGAENLVGGSGNDNLQGTVTANRLEGGPGDDVLDGHEQDDRLDGGPGADTLLGGGGVGNDCVDYRSRTAAVTAVLGVTSGNGEAAENDSFDSSVDCVFAGSGGSLMVGNDSANGLIGGAGDDVMLGGLGGDTFDGGPGADTVSYADHAAPVEADLDGIRDDGQAKEGDQVQPNVEKLVGGAGADRLTGSARGEELDGGAGDDVLDGGAGADVLHGSAGTDTVTYAGRTAPVTVTLDGAAGDGEAAEGDLVDADVENATGGEAADRLTGSGGANVLVGGGGDDVLDGGLGADVLGGGAGVDVATYVARSTRLVIRLDDLAGDGAKGEGDNVRTDVENVVGGRKRDKIIGSAAANVLTGGRGADVLKGRAGQDRALGGAGKDRCVAEVERSCVS
jgi:Ca2+-binding RTX toxin-like protein